ncbi:MAG: tRNA lysidine(34) synthetase TilS [Cypionkella sp.]|nr:tRNA lysidine(34) synthetase TilS [Cypionkella sp.]
MTADLVAKLLQGLGVAQNAPLGLGVSGGGDSLAMLYLAHSAGLEIRAVTVDHGLRDGSAEEAAAMARICAGLGVAHSTLRWQRPKGAGNLQDQARRARRELIGDWARRAGLQAVALAHTQDDVAETFLMRLSRGAGVDGLSAMAGDWHEGGLRWLRPLLGVSRAGLRAYLRGRGAQWADDPSNESDRFQRVRARKALMVLADFGLSAQRLAEVAVHLEQARVALERAADAASCGVLGEEAGAVWIAREGFAALVPEMQRRLLHRLLLWMEPADYAPRGAAVERLRRALLAGKAATLAGCRFVAHHGALVALREVRSGSEAVAQGEVWNRVWRIEGPVVAGAEIRALGAAGLKQLPDWRRPNLPRAALLVSPALWQGERLVAAPVAKFGPEWRCLRAPAADQLFDSALSH